MTIHYMAEAKHFKGYSYPTQDGVFCGKLMGASWATHSIIHTYWQLDNGNLIDCALFKNTRPKDIEQLPDNVYAELTLVKADSGKIYLRGIREMQKGERRMIFT